MMVRWDAGRIRVFTRNGHDWTGRFPLIVAGAKAIKANALLIDGEAVVCRCARRSKSRLNYPTSVDALLSFRQESKNANFA